MASHTRSYSSRSGAPGEQQREKTYFEQQREMLIGEIALSFEHVLANINRLNRGLEATIAVGNEFSSVEALWSQFENVMDQGKPDDARSQQQQTQPQQTKEGTLGGEEQGRKGEESERTEDK